MSNVRTEQKGGFSNGMESLIRAGIQEQKNLIQEFRRRQRPPQSLGGPRALAVFPLVLVDSTKTTKRLAESPYVMAADVTVLTPTKVLVLV
jgi:hypothetical protein